MEFENVDTYPVLAIPKRCTSYEFAGENDDDIFVNLNITSKTTEGAETVFYRGLCKIKFVDSVDNDQSFERLPEITNLERGIDQMPVVLSEANQISYLSDSQPHIWIDPSRSPYLYNNYDSNETYCIHESDGCITVEQHNTYITKNIYSYNESNVYNYEQTEHYKPDENAHTNQMGNYSETYQQPSGTSGNQRVKSIEDGALKQLMSQDIQSGSKHRKTILYLGDDSYSGETIQNISYNDPNIQCTAMGPQFDNEVIVESEPEFKKKKYQCDKCKQIFNNISNFRRHIDNHNNLNVQSKQKITFECLDCGKQLKDQWQFEKHCLGHGDPDRECTKCYKVFASKVTLRSHRKIHERKHKCRYCVKSYNSYDELKGHLERIHFIFLCFDENCNYMTSKYKELEEHNLLHTYNVNVNENENDIGPLAFEEVSNETVILDEEINLKSEDEVSDEILDVQDVKEAEGNRLKNADMVIAKVMANKIFLLNSKGAKKHRLHRTCEVCFKHFDRIGDLKRHLIEHVIKSTLAKSPVSKNGLLKITCEVCQLETFTKIDKYKAHLREHAKLTIYKCTFCDKSFSDSSNFSKHKKTHGESYLQCDLCQRKFNSKKMIAQHMEYHKNTTPVQCRFCDKVFHFESMLKKHIRCTHTKEDTSKFRCRFCDDVFKSLKCKWDHEWKIHNIRKMIADCRICGSKFRKYAELKRHSIDEHGVEIPSAKKFLKKKKRHYNRY